MQTQQFVVHFLFPLFFPVIPILLYIGVHYLIQELKNDSQSEMDNMVDLNQIKFRELDEKELEKVAPLVQDTVDNLRSNLKVSRKLLDKRINI